MRGFHLFKKSGLLLVLLTLSGAQAGCSWFYRLSDGAQVEPDVSGTSGADHRMMGFRYSIPLPNQKSNIVVTEIRPQVFGSKTGIAKIPAGFSLQSFVDDIFNSSGKPISAPERERMPKLASVKKPPAGVPTGPEQAIAQAKFCAQIDGRLSSIKYRDCMAFTLEPTGHVSTQGQPIMISHFERYSDIMPAGRVLLIGGVHGNELSGVSIVFEWMQLLNRKIHRDFVWDVVPVMNPDGLFHQPGATRTNANGVDLNRNMPTANWQDTAIAYWKDNAKASVEKYPGDGPASESETRWLISEIQHFQPDMIITVHAPYNLIDYDAPSRKNAPRHFGRLKGGLLGTYPGSLGNYAGVKRGIPVVTIELPDSYKAIPVLQAGDMWTDMLQWMSKTIPLENRRFLQERYYAEARRS